MKRFLLLSIFLIVAACDSKKDEPQETDIDTDDPAIPAQTTREPAKPPAPHAPGMNDGEIAMIASTGHSIEVELGELAAKKTKNPDVLAFAQMMITDHGAAKAKGEEVLRKARIEPIETDMSREMRAKADETRKQLEALEGAELDRTYVSGQVKAHEQKLDALDTRLIPMAAHVDLEKLLVDGRPVVTRHLEHARQLEAKLQASPAAPSGY